MNFLQNLEQATTMHTIIPKGDFSGCYQYEVTGAAGIADVLKKGGKVGQCDGDYTEKILDFSFPSLNIHETKY